jgi:hypothetical protein
MATCVAVYTVSGNWRCGFSKYLAERTSANMHKPLITVTISPAIRNDKGLLSKYQNTIQSNAGVNDLVHRRHSHEPRTFENSTHPSLVSIRNKDKKHSLAVFCAIVIPTTTRSHPNVHTVRVKIVIQAGSDDVSSASNLNIHHMLQCPGRVRVQFASFRAAITKSWNVDRFWYAWLTILVFII